MTEVFNLKTVAEEEPLVNDPYFAWLEANARKGDGVDDMDRLCAYLAEQGFVKGEHKLTEDTLRILGYVADTWYRTTPWSPPQRFDTLFVPGGTPYSVVGVTPKLGISEALIDILENAGWIYPVRPDTTYFEITHGRLFAKYQQILGSRFLCVISDWEDFK